MQLAEDELSALRELQESQSLTSDADASSSDDHATGTHCGYLESDHQDAAEAGYDSTEGYHCAEEDEDTGTTCRILECPS